MHRQYLLNHLLGSVRALPYLCKKYTYYQTHKAKPDFLLTEYKTSFDTLQQKGVVVIPQFIDKLTTRKMIENLPHFEQFEESFQGDKARFYRLNNISNAYQPFYQNEVLNHFARSHVGENVVNYQNLIEWRWLKGMSNSFDRMFHMDSWRYRLKGFLYLHDVTEEDAPLVYLEGSQKGLWRFLKEAEWDRYYGDNNFVGKAAESFAGCFWPHEIEELKKDYGLKEKICTGNAGTLILFDSRGLHRATPLKSEYRKILITYWIQKGYKY